MSFFLYSSGKFFGCCVTQNKFNMKMTQFFSKTLISHFSGEFNDKKNEQKM